MSGDGMDEIQEDSRERPPINKRKKHFGSLLMGLCLAAIFTHYLLSGKAFEDEWLGWASIFIVLISSIFSSVALVAFVKNWDEIRFDAAFDAVWGGIVKTVFWVIAVGAAVWGFFIFIETLEGTPPWAVVIIFLLLILLFQRVR